MLEIARKEDVAVFVRFVDYARDKMSDHCDKPSELLGIHDPLALGARHFTPEEQRYHQRQHEDMVAPAFGEGYWTGKPPDCAFVHIGYDDVRFNASKRHALHLMVGLCTFYPPHDNSYDELPSEDKQLLADHLDLREFIFWVRRRILKK